VSLCLPSRYCREPTSVPEGSKDKEKSKEKAKDSPKEKSAKSRDKEKEREKPKKKKSSKQEVRRRQLPASHTCAPAFPWRSLAPH
jgi:hypothetical protein